MIASPTFTHPPPGTLGRRVGDPFRRQRDGGAAGFELAVHALHEQPAIGDAELDLSALEHADLRRDADAALLALRENCFGDGTQLHIEVHDGQPSNRWSCVDVVGVRADSDEHDRVDEPRRSQRGQTATNTPNLNVRLSVGS
jgi:hypothetical protein